MIYVLSVLLVAQYAILAYILRESRKERAELNDRIMALSNPVALSVMPQKQEPGNVSYVDEAREAELSPSWQN